MQEGGIEIQKECKDLFTDMGFHVKEACKKYVKRSEIYTPA